MLYRRYTMHIDLADDNDVEMFINEIAEELKKLDTKDKDANPDKYKAAVVSHITASNPNVKTVKTSAKGNVEGLTDTSKYTGAHKERFDESGKGKGAAGRTDKVENTGYVGNYKNAGSYGKK
ncbi:hypothetical protein KUTeg_004433 [Tegillarca granosa]|uniref:Uncharacterized protein n=1 Tax=Tegillarca granosa TaxID=220873 RepID=A0ABQ9FPX4_TEGGR|nr:hypothetical protein KUTeg_004433 [Tegillarca granosa]